MILTSLTLLVPVSPTIAGSGPEGSVEEVTVTVSSPTSLLCEAQSYPPALITWLREGSPFESGHNIRVLPGVTPGMAVKDEQVNSLMSLWSSSFYRPWFHRRENAADSQCKKRGRWEVYLRGRQ